MRYFWQLLYAFKQALRGQRLQPYGGAVAAFLAEDPYFHNGADARELLLERYMPRAQLFRVAGTHMGCLRPPHVTSLAEAVRGALRQAGAGESVLQKVATPGEP